MKHVQIHADGSRTEIIEPPTLLEKAAMLVAEVAKLDVLHPTISEIAYQARLTICDTCPKLTPDTKQCMQCGCFMTVKAKLTNATCPLKKW